MRVSYAIAAFAHVADTIRGLLPMAERLGVVKPRDVDVDTLADRLRDDVVRRHCRRGVAASDRGMDTGAGSGNLM